MDPVGRLHELDAGPVDDPLLEIPLRGMGDTPLHDHGVSAERQSEIVQGVDPERKRGLDLNAAGRNLDDDQRLIDHDLATQVTDNLNAFRLALLNVHRQHYSTPRSATCARTTFDMIANWSVDGTVPQACRVAGPQGLLPTLDSSRGLDMKIRTVGVLGCGLMGSGIAQVSAQAGYKTIVLEPDAALVEKGLGRIRKFLTDGVTRGKVTAESREAALANLSGTTTFDDLSGSELIIEAVTEDVDTKRRVFGAADAVVGTDAILVSNTSSVCITELAATTTRPDRFAGLHFFSPVPIMKLVEVIRGLTTSDATYEHVMSFARSVGKDPVTAPDRPGFIVNRLLVPYLMNAIRAYESGLGTLEDIDKSMTLGCGHPMGPFTLLDFVGLDTTYYIASIMYEEFRELAYAPPPLLKRMVLAGRLGRKSGHGFFTY